MVMQDFHRQRMDVLQSELEKINDELRRAKKELEVSRNIMHYLHENFGFEELIRKIIKDVRGATDFDNIGLFFNKNDSFHLDGVSVNRKGEYSQQRFELRKTDVLKIINNEQQAKLITLKPEESESLKFSAKNVIIAPIFVKGNIIAFITADNSGTGNAVSPADIKSLTFFSDTLATAIENYLLYNQTEKELAKTSALYKTSQAVISTFSLNDLLKRVLNVTIDVLKADVGSVWLLNEEAQELEFKQCTNEEHKKVLKDVRLKLGEGIAGSVALHGRPEIVRKARESDEFNPEMDVKTGYHTESVICAPLILKGKVIGVIQLLNKKDSRDFLQEDLDLITALGAQISVSIENITLYENLEQKVRERTRELEQSEKKRIDYFNNTIHPSFLASPEGTITSINPVYKRTFDVEDEEMIGRHVIDEFVTRGVSDKKALQIWERLKRRNFIDRNQIVANTKKGKKIHLELSATFTKDSEGDLNGVQGQMVIVTRRKKMQFKLNERQRELEKMNEKLKLMDQQKDEFLSYVSHELRTPITSVLGYSNLLISGNMPEDNVKESLQIIYEEGQRLLNMINDLLDLAKIESGRVQMNKEEVNLNELISGSVKLLQSMASSKNINLSFEAGFNETIKADPGKLNQVLNNLLSNAIKFTPASGTIKVGLKDLIDKVVISVSDTGIGLKEEDIPKIFDKFQQIPHNLENVPKGTGLGMPITKQIVEAHKGEIKIESEFGKGTTFFVTLPKHDLEAEGQPENEPDSDEDLFDAEEEESYPGITSSEEESGDGGLYDSNMGDSSEDL